MHPALPRPTGLRRRLSRLLPLLLLSLGAPVLAWVILSHNGSRPNRAAAEAAPQPLDPAELAKRPIAVGGGEVGDLLRRWWAEGTAAGNAGDWYDNRDRDHSPLDLKPWPQLQRVVYTAEDSKKNRDWAAQTITRGEVTFGNSSTSAPPLQGGSNIRQYYTQPGGLNLLYSHYRHSNLYIYPEHRDHDPGHNGKPDGYGDLYPTNTPYLIASQGSSGSDQPFMRALPYTLAAFRPEVKKKLVNASLLMPTLQMIFRSCNKQLGDPKEYLTGKAHPTVFEGSWVDPLKMVKTAHDMEAGNVPPMVQLKVTKEDQPVWGIDFFDASKTEKLADTPASISRIFRGRDYLRKLVVSAEGSYDENGKPLTFHWAVLRGDAGRIKIRPLNAAGSVAELVVPYHDRRPVAPGSALESNRVDIGVFVHNGVYHSAPAFVTFFSLDNEARTYDEAGRLLEIGYDRGEVALTVRDWLRFLQAVTGEGARAKLFHLNDKERSAVAGCWEAYRDLERDLAEAQLRVSAASKGETEAKAAHKAAEAQRLTALKEHETNPSPQTKAALDRARTETAELWARSVEAEARARAAQKSSQRPEKAVQEFLNKTLPGLGVSLRELFERRLSGLADSPTFYSDHSELIRDVLRTADARNLAAVREAKQRLLHSGLLKDWPEDRLVLHPIRAGSAPAAERLTAYERFLLKRFNGIVLSELFFPNSVANNTTWNFVDQRLSVPKTWRDVYRHDDKGEIVGWTRYHEGKATEFNAEGLIIVEKDDQGRGRKARTVNYSLDAKTRIAYDQPQLRFALGNEVLTYEYDGPQDLRGRVQGQENVKE